MWVPATLDVRVPLYAYGLVCCLPLSFSLVLGSGVLTRSARMLASMVSHNVPWFMSRFALCFSDKSKAHGSEYLHHG
jgi:hypothetical protein